MLTLSSSLPASTPSIGLSSPSTSASYQPIGLSDIKAASARIVPYIRRTPTVRDAMLSERFGTNVYLKLELLQSTGAFKVRGAFNRMLTLSAEQLDRGVVAVSAGNHAQAVAFASRELGRRALILMPADTPENYLAETKRYGAEVRLFPTMADAFAAAGEYEAESRTLIHPFDDPYVIAGQGTIGLEILEDVPDVTDVVVSIGGGGLAAGVAAAVKSLRPEASIWGVETRGAHSMSAALDAGQVVELRELSSVARTLCAPAAGHLPFELVRKYLSGVTVVEDAEAVTELFYLLDRAKVLTEPASSCTLAAANRLRGKFAPDGHAVLILCGGNLGLTDLFDLRRFTTPVELRELAGKRSQRPAAAALMR
ncbi:MAG: threonine/serine dehydratase [Pyrinomonadaceae bacterium]